jgi:diguanylate cyclase (GGDEF)-like protein
MVAERIRKRISSIPFHQTITISIGISHYGEHGTTWEDVFKKADEALYYAKTHGRNRSVVYGEY